MLRRRSPGAARRRAPRGWPRRSAGRSVRARQIAAPPRPCRHCARRPAPAASAGAAGRHAARRPSRPRASHSQASSRSAKRAGRRSASQRSSRRSCAAGFSARLACTWPCSRAVTSASSRHSTGTFSRSHSGRSSVTLRSSCPRWRGSTSAGVVPLPRSWHRQAKRTGSEACTRAAWSSTIIRCTPVSTSGWCSGGCGTPHSRSTSGSSTRSAPHSRSSSNMREGVASIRPRASSCHTRSATSALHLAGLDHAAHQRQRLGRDAGSRQSARRNAPRAGCAPGLRRRPRTHGAARGRAGRRWPP